MADLKISQLTALVAAGVDAAADVLPIVDTSAVQTKKITVANLKTAVAPDLSTYAPLASPALTGSPTAPTAAVDTNTTQVATTAYVVGQAYAKLASPALTGTPTAPTASSGTNTTQIATTAFVTSAVSGTSVDYSSDQNILNNAVFN